MPQRIQLSRKKGWKKPDDAIVVARPTAWGNPWHVVADKQKKLYTVEGPGGFFFPPTEYPEGAHKFAVALYRQWLTDPTKLSLPAAARGDTEAARLAVVRTNILVEMPTLTGHDLACWCALELACHADVLLQLANQEPPSGA